MKSNNLISLILFMLYICIASLNAQTLVKDLAIGNGDSNPTEITKFGSHLFFITKPTENPELWKTMGQESNTEKVLDLNDNSQISLVAAAGRLLIIKQNSISYLDNENTSIESLIEIDIQVDPTSIIEVNSKIYFLGIKNNQSHLFEFEFDVNILNPLKSYEIQGTFINLQISPYENEHRFHELLYDDGNHIIYFKGRSNNEGCIYAFNFLDNPIPSTIKFGSVNFDNEPIVLFNQNVYTVGFLQNMDWQKTALIQAIYNSGNVDLSHNEINMQGLFPNYLISFDNNLYFFGHENQNFYQSLLKLDVNGDVTKVDFSLDPIAYPDFNQFYTTGFPYENPFRLVNNKLYVLRSNVLVQLAPNIGLTPSMHLTENNGTEAIAPTFIFEDSGQFYSSRYSENPQINDLQGNKLTSFEQQCDCTLGPFIQYNNSIFFAAKKSSSGNELYSISSGNLLRLTYLYTDYCDTITYSYNGDFALGTPPGGDQSIQFATSWTPIWADTISSTADFYNTSDKLSPYGNPIPESGGNYAGFWVKYDGDKTFREGIMTSLLFPLHPNTGCYKLKMKLACLSDHFNAPILQLYGVKQTAQPFSGPIESNIPSNEDLFLPQALLMDEYLIQSDCDENYRIIELIFNSNGLTEPLDRIFLTSKTGLTGGVYIAADDICMSPSNCDNIGDNSCSCFSITETAFHYGMVDTLTVNCFDDPVFVPCAGNIDQFSLNGKLNCSSEICTRYLKFSVRNSINEVIDSGFVQVSEDSNSWFISLTYDDYDVNDTNTIELNGICGDSLCFCKIKFYVDSCSENLCTCDDKATFTLSKGNKTYNLLCNEVEPKLQLDCPIDDLIIQGNWGCKPSFPLSECNLNIGKWEVYRDSNLVFGSTYTGPMFERLLPQQIINIPGLYTLEIETNCPDSHLPCKCKLQWEEMGCLNDTCFHCDESTQEINLIENGDFSSGNLGFTSEYTYFNSGNFGVGGYSVRTSVNPGNPWWSCIDHTENDPNGKFLVVDCNNPNRAIWQQKVDVILGKKYYFCAWINNLNAPEVDVAGLDFIKVIFDNNIVIAQKQLTPAPDQWIKVEGEFVAPTTGSYSLKIVNTDLSGNSDIAIDDISFFTCTNSVTCQNCINQGPELFRNGSFFDTSENIISQYTYKTSGVILPGEIGVRNSNNLLDASWECVDHTENDVNGNFLVTNSNNDPAKILFVRPFIPIAKDSTYQLCFWVKNISTSVQNDEALLEVSVSDLTESTFGSITIPDSEKEWTNVEFTFKANTNFTTAIYFYNRQTSGKAELAFDDISLVKCQETSSVLDLNLTNFSIYPNPTTGQLTIQFSSTLEQDISLKVFDILGRELNNGFIQKGNISHNFFIDDMSGIYIIQMTDSDGNMSQRKVIKIE